jgi:5-methylcytosine-specific restriction endonuclease McrA
MAIKVFANVLHPKYDQPIVAHRKKIACSIKCLNQWQRDTKWEDRIGEDTALIIREARREQIKKFNPSTVPEIAERISNSVKKYIEDNPQVRLGENNPFYGHKHSEKTIEHWKTSKSGKWSYSSEQYDKQRERTPKLEDHPNWNGGSSLGEYGVEFTKELKSIIKEQYNYTCQVCNLITETLDIHHIDYDKKNNSGANLVPLCKKCHGKTNYNREVWKKFFQKT